MDLLFYMERNHENENNTNDAKKGGAWERGGIHSLSDAKIQKREQRFKRTTSEEEKEKAEAEDKREAGGSSLLVFRLQRETDGRFRIPGTIETSVPSGWVERFVRIVFVRERVAGVVRRACGVRREFERRRSFRGRGRRGGREYA